MGGKEYLLKDLVAADQAPAYLSDGLLMKLRIVIPFQEKFEEVEVTLMNLKDSQAKETSIGFQGWLDCDARFQPGFRFKNYSTSPGKYRQEHSFSYEVTLFGSELPLETFEQAE